MLGPRPRGFKAAFPSLGGNGSCGRGVGGKDEPPPHRIWGHACAAIDIEGTGIVTDPVLILGPPPVAAWVAKDPALAPRVRVMKPGDQLAFAGGRVIAVPAHHPGGRLALRAKTDGNALGYVIEARGVTLYYSGDTGALAGLARIGRTYRPDIVLLNVNAHLHSEAARAAAGRLRRRSRR